MKKKTWKVYTFWILLAEGVGALSGWLSRNGMKAYETAITQPPLSPPSWIFPIVWGILYALMGIGAARVWLAPRDIHRSRSLNLFIVQLIVNFFWSLIFFNARAYGFAFLWLLILLFFVIWMTFCFWKTDKLSGILQILYILWLLFAAYLNFAIWQLN